MGKDSSSGYLSGMWNLFFKILFIYLRESMSGGGVEGEAGSPPSREPDAGLDPKTPRSWPEPKADAQPTEPRRHPWGTFSDVFFKWSIMNNEPILITLLTIVANVYFKHLLWLAHLIFPEAS